MDDKELLAFLKQSRDILSDFSRLVRWPCCR